MSTSHTPEAVPATAGKDVKPLAAVKILAREHNLRYLIGVRIGSQGGDGLFEVGLASLFFFSPERASTTAGVAFAFGGMLVAFTLLGASAGLLLVLCPRRRVL